MLLALFVFILSSFFLWQNVNQAHLYLYSIDSGNGHTLAQQDLGSYSQISSLSNPTQGASSLLLGVSTASSKQQQVLSLTGSDTSWHVAQQFSAPPGRSTLSIGPDHLLAIEHNNGLQIMTTDGRVLWQTSGDTPALGAHPFTPAFNRSTIYTVRSASRGIIVAYDIHSGKPRWSVHIDDTLRYAPPLLLSGDLLYVAGDRNLYALNTITGGTRWKTPAPFRTLLYSSESTPAIIGAGPSGLTAFDAQTGNLLWSFNGQPGINTFTRDTLTAAQFYQADLSPASHTLYATGIAWDTQQTQQQLWLFAINAATGRPTWSQRIGTGFTSADSGRIFSPFINASHKLIVIEQALPDGSQTLSAFDAKNGFQRWTARLAEVSASTLTPIQLASATLGLFSVQTDASIALRNGSAVRPLIVLAIASLLSLLLLWVFPFKRWLSRMNRHLRRLPRYMITPLRGLRRLWRFSHLLFALMLLAALACAGLLTYTRLNQQYSYIKQVGADNGSTLWQHPLSSPVTLAGIDNAGLLVITDTEDHTFELSALNSNGSPRWTLPSGQSTFSFPHVATGAGTLLAVLNAPIIPDYHFAPADPAYSNPLAHYFTLDLLDSHTGRILWKNNLIQAGALQDARVLGADSQFIYIASRSLQQNPVVQLIAIDKTSGSIAWRFYGPHQQPGAVPDFGAVLAQGNTLYWQVNSGVYALSSETGQVEWRDALAEVNTGATTLEEGQMAIGAGVLLIRRSDIYHALDLVTGAEHWTLTGLGPDNPRAPGGIIVAGNKFILYGSGSIEAFDPATQSILWKHLNLVAVTAVSLSPDSSLVYAVVFNNIDGGTNQQALVAFDVNSDLIHWTFQPDAQAQFVYAGSRILYTSRGVIYASTCYAGSQGNCTRQVLYAIDGKTGKARWKTTAPRVYDLQGSADNTTITYQTSTSAWDNLKAWFQR